MCIRDSHYTKGTTEHFVETIGERIGTIHASDFDFVNECHWLPTQGDIKWGKLMHALEGVGYEGVFMYEATKDHESHDTRPTPERVVETFNKIINDYTLLETSPFMGTSLSSILPVKTDYRYFVSGKYLIFYKVDNEFVSIYRILYGRRDYMRILFSEIDSENEEE